MYAFSSENWKRTEEEVSAIMSLAVRMVTLKTSDYKRRGVRIMFIGRRDRLQPQVLQAMDRCEPPALLTACRAMHGLRVVVRSVADGPCSQVHG